MAQNELSSTVRKLRELKHGYTETHLSHDDVLSLFCVVLNVVQPDHPGFEDPYPIEKDEIEYSYKKSSSSTYASCGPRYREDQKVAFKADVEYFNNQSMERVLAINTHEITHVTVGSHSDQEHGSHPPRFWREFGFNSHIILDNWDIITDHFGAVSKEKFIGHVVRDEVNQHNIDKRYSPVEDRRHEMAKWFKNTLKTTPVRSTSS